MRGSWRLDLNTVRLWYARLCLNWHRTQRFQTYIGVPFGSGGDPADFSRPIRVPFN